MCLFVLYLKLTGHKGTDAAGNSKNNNKDNIPRAAQLKIEERSPWVRLDLRPPVVKLKLRQDNPYVHTKAEHRCPARAL